jgi:hypothetical protein
MIPEKTAVGEGKRRYRMGAFWGCEIQEQSGIVRAGKFSYNGMKVCVTLPMLVVGILRAIKCQYPVPVIVGFTIAAKAFSVWVILLAGIRTIPAGTSLAEGIRMKRADREGILACHSHFGATAARGFVMESVRMFWLRNSIAWNMDIPARLRSHLGEKVNCKGEFVRRCMS